MNISSVPKLLAMGSAKQVYETAPESKLVYYTARFGKTEEIKKELIIAKKIKNEASIKNLSTTHLAVNLIPSKIGINNKFTIETDRASGDLEKEIRKATLKFTDRANLALQVLDGFRILHKAGFTHGDIKPENFLLYKQGNQTVVKLSDWGKTQSQSPEKTTIYLGNAAFSSPEYKNSHQAEVYSLGLVLMRIFEEALLTRDSSGQDMILAPKQLKKRFHIFESNFRNRGLRGFIKYIYSHSESSQPRKWIRLYRAWRNQGNTVKLVKEKKKNEQLTHEYIDQLFKKLQLNTSALKKLQDG